MLLLLMLICLSMFAEANGSLTQFGEKKILTVWGNHYERGFAQGYYLAPQIKQVFQDFYWTMFCFSNLEYYNLLWGYYMEHFNPDTRMVNEAGGMVEGMAATGISMYHAGLGREIMAEDILLLNSAYDMVNVRRAFSGKNELELGCASLSSWGNATAADSLLAGSSVITRFLDVSQNSAFISSPLIVVHRPTESDEQKWINFTMPGFIGSLSAISESRVFASLNTGDDNFATDINNLSPILFDLRRGIERTDYDQNSVNHPMDIYTSIAAQNNLSATMTHTLSEASGVVHSSVIERKNSAIANRLYNQNGSLPAHNLAVTNHFRVLSSGTCCSRYSNIQDSLYSNTQVTAKRQWQVLAGAAGLETNLQAIQFIPSTGDIIWASATLEEPAYMRPGIILSTDYLFTNPVSNLDELSTPVIPKLSVYPNPLSAGKELKLFSSEGLAHVEVYNLKGQKVMSFNPEGKAGSVLFPADWDTMPRGIYLIRGKTQSGKLRNAKMVLQ
jgi:hypothetical protein